MPEASTAATFAIIARSHLDDFTPTLSASGKTRAISLAAQNIKEARERDPLVVITRKDFTYTLDDLSAECIYYEAIIRRTYNDYKQAKELLELSATYGPHLAYIQRMLALVNLELFDREAAIAAAKKAVDINPYDVENIKLLQKIEADRDLGRKKLGHYAEFIGIGGWCLIILGVVTLNIYLVIVGSISAGVGRFLQYERDLKRALNGR